jgi:hypothetical protein
MSPFGARRGFLVPADARQIAAVAVHSDIGR